MTAVAAQKLSAKQEKAIQQRLADLNKENHRDNVNIPIPKKAGAPSKKTTPNVRRILAYSRTFQHYLADEEAGVNVYGSAGNVAVGTSTADSKKRGSTTTKEPTPVPKTKRTAAATAARMKKAAIKKEEERKNENEDVEMTDAVATGSQMSQQTITTPTTAHTPGTAAAPTVDLGSLDRHPLLKTRDLPKMPSDRVMAALLAEPPLGYVAARALPVEEHRPPPPRFFCSVCGYWGKIRCGRACGERVCGLMECWRAHQLVCPLAAY